MVISEDELGLIHTTIDELVDKWGFMVFARSAKPTKNHIVKYNLKAKVDIEEHIVIVRQHQALAEIRSYYTDFKCNGYTLKISFQK